MSQKGLLRFTAISGFTSVILYILVAVLLGDSPKVSDPEIQVSRWIIQHNNLILFAAYTWGLCISATFCFITGFWGILKQKEGENGVLSTLGLGAGFSIFTLAFAGFIFVLGAAYRSDSLSPSIIKLLNDLALLSVALTGFPTVVSVGAFTTVILTKKLYSKWLGWFGIFVCLAHLISGGAFALSGLFSPSGIGVYVAPVLYYLWIMIISAFTLSESKV